MNAFLSFYPKHIAPCGEDIPGNIYSVWTKLSNKNRIEETLLFTLSTFTILLMHVLFCEEICLVLFHSMSIQLVLVLFLYRILVYPLVWEFILFILPSMCTVHCFPIKWPLCLTFPLFEYLFCAHFWFWSVHVWICNAIIRVSKPKSSNSIISPTTNSTT